MKGRRRERTGGGGGWRECKGARKGEKKELSFPPLSFNPITHFIIITRSHGMRLHRMT